MDEQDDKAAWTYLVERLRAAGGVVDNIRLGRVHVGAGCLWSAARAPIRLQMAPYQVADADELFSLVLKINKDWFRRAVAMIKGGAAKLGLKEFRAVVKLQLKALEGLQTG